MALAFEVRVRGRLGAWFVRRGWRGLTVGPFIFYWLLPGEDVDPEVRRHEFEHVHQEAALGPGPIGWVGFWILYWWFHVRYGYAGNPLELAAYAAQDTPYPDLKTWPARI